MTISKQGRLTARRISTGAVSSAVVAGMLLVVNPAPAGAATTVTVTNADIRGDETTYAGWHQGYANAELSAGVTSDGLEMIGQSQVIKGYPNNDATGLAANGVNADLDTVLPGASYDVKAGSAYFQVALFVDADDSAATPPVFTTLRPAAAATSNDTIASTDAWVSTSTVDGIAEDTEYPLSQILTEIGSHSSKTIAFGVLTENAGTVGSISWDGTTYSFSNGAPTASVVRNAEVRGTETGSYSSWHQGYDNASASQQVTADGLVLAGRSQVIKGFANNSNVLNAVNANLRFVLPDASYTVAPGADPAFFQVAVFFDNGDGVKFATLRNGGEGSGTNTIALNDQWQSSKAIGAIPANTDAELGDLIDALGTYKTIGFGVLTNAGTTSTVSNITFANRSYDFAEAATAPTTTEQVKVRDIRADETTYAGWHQGATGAAAAITADANSTVLSLGSVRSQLLNGLPNNSNDLDDPNGVNLVDALTGASYTVSSGDAFFQVALFAVDPSSGQTVFATLRPADAAETGTNLVDVGQEWVSSKAIGDIAANTPVILGDLLNQLTSAKVVGYGVYTDAGGNAKISDITFNGTRSTFIGNRSAVVAAVNGTTTSGHTVTLPLKGTDADGDTITYTVATPAKGTAAISGGTSVKFTAPVGYVGTTSFSYTATDNLGPSTTGTVTVKVGQVRTALGLKAVKGPGKKTFIRVKVSAPGAIVNGGQVQIKRLGKVVATGKVVNGTVRLQVGKKLPKGARYYGVYFKGTASATAKSVLFKVVTK